MTWNLENSAKTHLFLVGKKLAEFEKYIPNILGIFGKCPFLNLSFRACVE